MAVSFRCLADGVRFAARTDHMTTPPPRFDTWLDLIEERSAALRAAAALAPEDAAVPSCPSWTVRDLVAHAGTRQRFWTAAVTAGPARLPPPEEDTVRGGATGTAAGGLAGAAAQGLAAASAGEPLGTVEGGTAGKLAGGLTGSGSVRDASAASGPPGGGPVPDEAAADRATGGRPMPDEVVGVGPTGGRPMLDRAAAGGPFRGGPVPGASTGGGALGGEPFGGGSGPGGVAGGGVLAWAAQRTAELLAALRAAGPDAGCWTWWAEGGGGTAGEVARHHAQEIALLARDAQDAAGMPEPLPPGLAAAGVDDFLQVVLGALDGWPHAPARVAVVADEGPAWTLILDATGASAVRAAPGRARPEADATLSAPASDLLLALHRRVPWDGGPLRVAGDAALVRQLAVWQPLA